MSNNALLQERETLSQDDRAVFGDLLGSMRFESEAPEVTPEVIRAAEAARDREKAREVLDDPNRPKVKKVWHWKPVETGGLRPTPREGHTSVAVEEYLVVFGGCFLDRECFGDVRVLDTVEDRWFAPVVSGVGPTPREGHSATLVADNIYVFGGSSEQGYMNDLYVLAVGEQSAGEQMRMAWGTVDVSGRAPSPREGHSATAVNERIFVFGGFTEEGYSNDLYVLNVALMAWEKPPVAGTAPSGREGHAATLFKDRIIVFGGFMDGGCLNDVAVLDTGTQTWVRPEVSGAPPRPRQDMSAVRRGHTILYTGGCNFARQECYADSFVLDLRERQWREASFLKDGNLAPREDHTVTLVRDRVLLFGGCFLAQACFDDVLELDSGDGWKCGGNNCSSHGLCSHGLCYCDPGYGGQDCSMPLSCPRNCSGHGKCLSTGECACTFGWAGTSCARKVNCLNDCSGHGLCLPSGECRCEGGWDGPHCGLCTPKDESVCSGNGRCVMPEEGEEAQQAEAAGGAALVELSSMLRGSGDDEGKKGKEKEEDAEDEEEKQVTLLVGKCKCKTGWQGSMCDKKAAPPSLGAVLGGSGSGSGSDAGGSAAAASGTLLAKALLDDAPTSSAADEKAGQVGHMRMVAARTPGDAVSMSSASNSAAATQAMARALQDGVQVHIKYPSAADMARDELDDDEALLDSRLGNSAFKAAAEDALSLAGSGDGEDDEEENAQAAEVSAQPVLTNEEREHRDESIRAFVDRGFHHKHAAAAHHDAASHGGHIVRALKASAGDAVQNQEAETSEETSPAEGCPDHCSQHGTCYENQCYCQQGWMGHACAEEEHSKESWNFEAHVVGNGFWVVLSLSFLVSLALAASYGCIKRSLGFKTRTDKLLRPGLF